MSVIFISHSSLDNARAIWMRDWLKANGWDQVFIDIDAKQGAGPALVGCGAVILLILPNWVTSPYCKTEYLFADTLGKQIIPVLIAPMAPGAITAEVAMKYQSVDVSTPEIEAEGLERLRVGMKRAGSTHRVSIGPRLTSRTAPSTTACARSTSRMRPCSSVAKPRSRARSMNFGRCAITRRSAC